MKNSRNREHRIAVLSDTHNLLRPEVIEQLKTCEVILHGGDISNQKILDTLMELAPVHVVRGNNDKDWAEHLPVTLEFELFGRRFFMVHKKKEIPAELSADVVVYGHSHKYDFREQNGVLYLNPGSCGPRRFVQPITMAILTISSDGWQVERVDIQHSEKEVAPKIDPKNIKGQIEVVVKEIQKGNGVITIAQKYGMDKALVEQIARLYLTHPGVTVEGIMTKMELLANN